MYKVSACILQDNIFLSNNVGTTVTPLLASRGLITSVTSRFVSTVSTSLLTYKTTAIISPSTSILPTAIPNTAIPSTSLSTYKTITIISPTTSILPTAILTAAIPSTLLSTYKTTAIISPTTSILPTAIPTVATSIESTLSQMLFRFSHPQKNPVVYEVMPNRKESVKLNCTAFYNGSRDDITIVWTSNNKLIYNDTESYIENFKITTILKVAGKSKETFTCTFHHSSGWNNSRDFMFTVDGRGTVT